MSAEFPWTVFSANTLRPMMADVMRYGGFKGVTFNKEESISLLQKIEKHGLDAALKELGDETGAEADVDAPAVSGSSVKRKRKQEAETNGDADISVSAPVPSTSAKTRTRTTASVKRRHGEEPADADNGAVSSEPARKRGRGPGRPRKVPLEPGAEVVSSASASRTRGRNSDLGEGLLTRRHAAEARGENIPSTRSSRPARKTSKKDGGSSVSAPAAASKPLSKPKSKGQVFDGVEIVKRPQSYVGKGKERETIDAVGDGVEHEGSDVDAEGELVDDAMEPQTGTSENSNKENEITITEVANEDTDIDAEGEVPFPDGIGSPAPQKATLPTDGVGHLNHDVTIDIGSPPPEVINGQDLLLPEHIGSPAPQITVEPTDDQIEEARLNHDISIDIGSPAPEITIEPLADDGDDDGDEIQFEGNGFSEEGGLLHPRLRLDIARAGTPLNPEYSIEVYSPGSAQHDSDDEMWVIRGINGNSEGLRAAGGGLDALD
ncbi:hypothetical protein B0H19DRAFT_1150011 [Mycena capillaripes]|nr:hypothetical protein B0H19DRAFT_1150011 [Mycena capillaripes]